jgi:PHD/YefM family antitoxin component YafN of YafNO toxin-antitoxin module
MKKKRMTVAEARAKLYDLVVYVTETPDSAVVIEHRDRKERAVLVDEGHYKYLEAMVKEARKDAKPFKLAGSILTPVGVAELDVEEMIAEVRRNDEVALQKKLDEIFADD